MPIKISSKGSFTQTDQFLSRMTKEEIFSILSNYGAQGVAALASATPKDTGATAAAWSYEVIQQFGRHSIIFHNSNLDEDRPIAILIQYGHATRNGGYVQGRDYINPVIRPLFDQIVSEVWKAVTK